MINRFYFIAESLFWSGIQLPEEENIYLSLLIDPSQRDDFEYAYRFMSGIHQPAFLLTLHIKEPLSEEATRFITSFMFLPSYLHVEDRAMINLAGQPGEMLDDAAAGLSRYLELQGKQLIINRTGAHAKGEINDRQRLFCQAEEMLAHYQEVLRGEQFFDNDIFLKVTSADVYYAAIAAIQEIEKEFKQKSPALYSLYMDKKTLEYEKHRLKKRNNLVESELDNQRQYTEILRSDHPTRELQQYYDREYEMLPAWYKRFGHILKVVMGKRTFRSLFRDDVKKYKD